MTTNYYRVKWFDSATQAWKLSDPIDKWTDACIYRNKIDRLYLACAVILSY